MSKRLAVIGSLLLLCLVFFAAPASAHGGPITVAVGSDGAQGVTAVVTYVNDHHMVSGQVDMTMSAVARDGRTAGPIRFVASAEGQAFYAAEQPLPPGTWTVTVVATQPSPAQQTVDVVSVAKAVAPAAPEPTPNVGLFVGIPAGIAVLCGLVFLGLLLRRRVGAASVSGSK
jgi:hypothetical protein